MQEFHQDYSHLQKFYQRRSKVMKMQLCEDLQISYFTKSFIFSFKLLSWEGYRGVFRIQMDIFDGAFSR